MDRNTVKTWHVNAILAGVFATSSVPHHFNFYVVKMVYFTCVIVNAPQPPCSRPKRLDRVTAETRWRIPTMVSHDPSRVKEDTAGKPVWTVSFIIQEDYSRTSLE
ncbi:Hypp7991 [Branchiostoma lanceolatum]|uniref:Hypp7991 protein n=1 Tax=Branchiostoma lanceolatum TaxID=7740 RepID=A0A8K0EG62_BRALA|nr:Hypp7991 [Branchiostoma lanceolatum]